ncbi:zinc-binding dehydrogenase [Nonomuraea sp. NPDC050310]|uniref:zinc-binding dehydrogenase n=1 Tax=Nonomuraea sp. NPDC050310 TaxID=3154935 RepID=UPI0033D825E1
MRAVVMDEFGGPEVLRVRSVEDPAPGPGQVLIAVQYASVTFVETQVRAGAGPFGRPALPRVPGNGVGGRIVAAGPEADPALVGTLVVSTTGGVGGYAELALAQARDVVAVPAGLDLADAVALLADGRTAVLLHGQAEVKPGERVLVEAAGGGVGSLLTQLAAASGAHVIGAARGAAKSSLVLSLGAAAYVDYGQPGWEEQARDLDLVFDGVGGELGTRAAALLRDGGRISVYGMASGAEAEIDRDRVRVLGLTGPPGPAEQHALITEALTLAAEGRLRPVIGQTFPLDQAAAAHQAIETRATTGKTLLTVSAS